MTHDLVSFKLEKVSNDGYLDIWFSHRLAVYYTLVAGWAIFSQMMVLIIHGWQLTIHYLSFVLNSATDQPFIVA